MKKPIAAAALVAAVVPLLVGAPASAHTPDIQIAGFQYFFSVGEIPPQGGTTGYLGTPAGPAEVGEPMSISEEEGLGTLINRDQVPHTFTECTSACDTAAGSSAGARFNVEVNAGASKALPDLAAGTYEFMCNTHKWMRGRIVVRG